MDKYEKSIREKVFASKVLTQAEWVYLIGLFGMARDHADCDPDEAKRLQAAAAHVCWFDWSGNDEDAVRAIEDLRTTLGQSTRSVKP